MFSNSGDAGKLRKSGGRSFFGQRKERSESKPYSDSSFPPEPSNTPSAASSMHGAASVSSRRSNKERGENDIDRPVDATGLHTSAGVVTSIPYDSTHDSKTPIPVDYVPKNEQPPPSRREPVPHHFNKGGDYHQYPAFEAPRPNQSYSRPDGPRALPQSTSTSSIPSRDRQKSTVTMNGSQATHSYSTTESASNPRNSFDQASIHSTGSSQTRGSSIFSSDNSSRTAIPPHMQQQQQQQSNSLRPSSSGSSTRQSTASSLKPSYHSATSFNPEGFSLQKPSNDQVIEEMFINLMHKRGWQNLPDQARRQMMAYPPAKKWTLVHQDKLTEWQGEQKRRTTARQTLGYTDGTANLQKADEEGSPEWYVKRILDDSITQKQLQSLAVSLRTQPIG
jgi:cytokinesis protein